MEKQLVMPKLQPEMKSGVLCAWLKDEGDEIHKGDALYEIETDKVVNQIEATEDGILRRQLCEEGDTIDALAPVAIVEIEVKAGDGMERKPEWLRVRYNQQAVSEVAELMRDLKLNTVCKAANCPNLGECYQKHTATFMILGDVCTRNCRFCNVTCGKPLPPRPGRAGKRRAGGKKAGAAPRRSDLLDARRFAGSGGARALCEDRPRHPRAVPRHDGRDADERHEGQP